MKQHTKHRFDIFRNIEASVTLELGFVLGFMMIAFIGMVELTSFIDAKQRVNKAVNETAYVLSSLPSWNGTSKADLQKILKQTAYSTRPEGAIVRARFCSGLSTKKVGGSSYLSGSTPSSNCGLLNSGPAARALYPTCGRNSYGSEQYVSIVGYCSYQPLFVMFDRMKLFKKGQRISAKITVPMREDMNW